MNIPTLLTAGRILLIPLFIYFLYFVPNKLYAFWLFFFICWSDFFDGYLARKLKQITTLGKFLDPLADKLLMVSAFIVLADLNYILAIWVIVIVAREMAMTGFRILAAAKNIVLAASQLGKLKTVLQMLSVGFLILNWPFALELFYLGIVVSLISFVEYVAKNTKVFED